MMFYTIETVEMKGHDAMFQFSRLLLDLIYPPRCLFCREVICPGQGALCCRCEAETPVEAFEIAPESWKVPVSFERAWAIFPYEGKIREVLLRMKFYGMRSVVRPLAWCAGQFVMKELSQNLKFDIIVSVPMHPSRRKERGFDQAALIASEIAVLTGIPYLQQGLVRTRQTGFQKELHAGERWANLQDAIQAGKILNKFEGKHILLVDDILTTGATADACSRVLFRSGAKRVSVIAIATGNARVCE